MTPLQAAQSKTRYIVTADFGTMGFDVVTTTTLWDDACDALADHREHGRDATVEEMSPNRIWADVTAEAAQHVAWRLVNRGHDLPDWCGGASGYREKPMDYMGAAE